MGCWHSYLTGPRCSFSYGSADPTATHCLLLQEIQVGFGFTFLVLAHSSSPARNPESHKTVVVVIVLAFSALTLLVGRQEGHLPVKTGWWSAGMVISLGRGADLHMAQLIPLPLTVFCFSKIQIGFTFLVPAHPDNPGESPEGCKTDVCVVLEQHIYG